MAVWCARAHKCCRDTVPSQLVASQQERVEWKYFRSLLWRWFECARRNWINIKFCRKLCKIEDVAILVRANLSQSVENLVAAVGVSHGTCYKIDWWPKRVTCYPVQCATHHDARATWLLHDDLWWSDVSQPDHNWRRYMVLPVQSATKATIRHLENAIIATIEKSETRQVRRQDGAWLFFGSNIIVHMEFIPEGATVNKTRYKEIVVRLRDSIRLKRPGLWRRKKIDCCYTTTPLHIALSLSKRNLQGNRLQFYHTLRTYLISHHAIFVVFPAW